MDNKAKSDNKNVDFMPFIKTISIDISSGSGSSDLALELRLPS